MHLMNERKRPMTGTSEQRSLTTCRESEVSARQPGMGCTDCSPSCSCRLACAPTLPLPETSPPFIGGSLCPEYPSWTHDSISQCTCFSGPQVCILVTQARTSKLPAVAVRQSNPCSKLLLGLPLVPNFLPPIALAPRELPAGTPSSPRKRVSL